MKITTFNPFIVTNDAAPLIELFEALGFERRHKKTGINDEDITSVRMRYTNEDGKVFHVDIAEAPTKQDFSTIRMNVDNFDETFEMLEKRGFTNLQGDRVTDTGSSRSTLMAAPTGFTINVTQHIKDHD